MCPLFVLALIPFCSSYAKWRFLHWIVGAGWHSIPVDPALRSQESG